MPIKSNQDAEYRYPIAEIFESLQGEGQWTGTLMTFIRLAGCTVGRPFTPAERSKQFITHKTPFALYQEKCTAWDGTEFACDTNYKAALKLSLAQLFANPLVVEAKRLCITGGEPLMHNLWAIVDKAVLEHKQVVHIETSGTIDILSKLDRWWPLPRLWFTVSPKANYLPANIETAHELKILIDAETFNRGMFEDQFSRYFAKTFVQPVNAENEINWDNVELCKQLITKYKQLRLSLQTHKILKVR